MSTAQRKATLDEFWAIPEGIRLHELVGGQLLPNELEVGTQFGDDPR